MLVLCLLGASEMSERMFCAALGLLFALEVCHHPVLQGIGSEVLNTSN
jgi:hypothetical protein